MGDLETFNRFLKTENTPLVLSLIKELKDMISKIMQGDLPSFSIYSDDSEVQNNIVLELI